MIEMKILHLVLSDIFTNLSAGWIGVIFITPNLPGRTKRDKIINLTYNTFFAIITLEVAYILRLA
ncbi:hypothetical protein A3H80_00610 [Candidatus Roizmanbacteria bacterium RIFCSPLOWO2_02_FULL_37_19]|uniref:Uncharacterized protein n=1 Tax=Candidatus Roizmanbacteria bacterium RIFCSPHIGHO2_02_FULL_37_24 TaxID=1802037 RepID=A0A1F7GUJ2_9BACT|nr:MAG: hypothetical protein A2862_00300 [Candidatus Roizmanbacteria bacterium RIFCSPHIGHO2_01_FULL_38_41]OGK22638.1 MAG: hypothetical protein A3C24_00415 [Candidatus Roizmanbacteria bacterium RIFCSPHIGHO2_02_FULL_37_24]OGK32489.1 MAG: hypothetical protein A3E10_00480 [Candidatus Roizmanbacteria bacterium RIFCSPHIGHO2_12_FULL_37_23]OGK54468.1 MAG: hypothetical protein A3H80_00610 [Candidatus Roizmanbacteria bacterium RIFCSPLOWO2_02_FULL_37_19]